MKKSQINQFFKEVGRRISWPVEIYLTGGVLAWFYGGIRPTQDLDFALLSKDQWEKAARILKEISQEQRIPIEFAEDISRWGMIGYSNFKKGAKLFDQFGSIKVFLLDPVIWSVGKIARYTTDDVTDLVAVFKKHKPDKEKVKKIWKEALEQSPRSSESHLFQKKVADFFKHYEKEIWG